MQRLIYLDESGDLGWKFDAPFGRGGSSRHLTIASVSACPETICHIGRLIKKIKRKAGFSAKEEMKWVDMPHELRLEFCLRAASISQKNPNIEYRSITVAKQGVQERLRVDDSMLYNYLVKNLLIEPIACCTKATLVPDPRGIAPNSGHPLHHYLQAELFSRCVDGQHYTELGIRQVDSKNEKGIQFADMLAGAIQLHYEGKTSEYFNTLRPYLSTKCFFFPAAERAEKHRTAVVEQPTLATSFMLDGRNTNLQTYK